MVVWEHVGPNLNVSKEPDFLRDVSTDQVHFLGWYRRNNLAAVSVR